MSAHSIKGFFSVFRSESRSNTSPNATVPADVAGDFVNDASPSQVECSHIWWLGVNGGMTETLSDIIPK